MKLPAITALLCLFVFTVFGTTVKANILDIINATVSIGICGNGVVEGAEQCDGVDLAGSTCQSLGYDLGNLVCDNACDFDPTVCSIVIAATPTPTTQTQQGTDDNVTETPPFQETADIVNPPLILIPVPRIPLDLIEFDTNQNGIIDSDELATAVGSWVDFWREKDSGDCDLNDDRVCNLVDFSILLYHSRP